MKKTIAIMIVLLLSLSLLAACNDSPDVPQGDTPPTSNGGNDDGTNTPPVIYPSEIPEVIDARYRETLLNVNAYGGYFTEDTVNIEVKCISGTPNCFTLEGNVLKFTQISADSVYSISGNLRGKIIIDVGDDFKFELEMHGLTLICEDDSPITVLSGDKVSLTAKKGFKSYVYDVREQLSPNSQIGHSGAIYASVDLEICGKGELVVISEHNNGIHTKDDLDVKNLTLTVYCHDNALKGNDSVTLESGNTTLISTAGDGIKTVNTDISSKGKQRGIISVLAGTHTVYAETDALDAAFDIEINEELSTLTLHDKNN